MPARHKYEIRGQCLLFAVEKIQKDQSYDMSVQPGYWTKIIYGIKFPSSVADPRFPPAGGVNPPRRRDFAKFSQKLHEIKRIWTPPGGGGGEGRASLTTALRSAMFMV